MKVCLQCEYVFSSDRWVCPLCGYQPEHFEGFEAHAAEFAYKWEGFKSEYFSNLAKLESASFWFQARNEIILWALQTYKPNANTLLEVGCGTGFVLSGIAKAHPKLVLYGSEILLAGLPHAAARVPSAHLMQMDARHLPFEDEFDVIGAFDVMEHIKEDEAVLAQLHRGLRSGGVLLLTVPQHRWLWSAIDDYACHVRRYESVELQEKILRAGFFIERSTSFVSLLLPGMFLFRRKKYPLTADDSAAEFRLPKSLNYLLLSIMRVEQYLVRLGVSFPIGGSRLIVAKKG